MKINKKRVSILIGCIGLCTYFVMNLTSNTDKKENKNKIEYKAVKLKNTESKSYIDVNGEVEANNTKKIYVDKKLKVKEIFIKEGDYIEKGKVLMTFDDSIRNALIRNIKKEEINLNKLNRNLKIEEELLKIGGSSKNTVIDLSEEIDISKLILEEYGEELEKTVEKIESPVSGTITKLIAEENYSVNTEQPLMEIADLTKLKIILEVPEYDVLNVKLGQEIDIKPEVYEKKKVFKGNITNISKVSTTSDSTNENVLEVEVEPKEFIPNLAPGFKVSGIIYLSNMNKNINISKNAVIQEKENYFVFTIAENGILKKNYIKIGEVKKGETIEVVSGIKKEDIILINPSEKLKDGDKINYFINDGKKKKKP